MSMNNIFIQFSSFASIGSFSFLIDFFLFNALLNYGANPLVATSISLSVSAVFGYFGNLKFTFGFKKNLYANKNSFLKFTLIGVFSIFLSQVIMGTYLLMNPAYSLVQINTVKLLSVLLLALFRFFIYKHHVFV